MKKLLTSILALSAAVVLIGFGSAQQARHEQSTAAPGIKEPAALEITEKPDPVPVVRIAKNKNAKKPVSAAKPWRKCHCRAVIGTSVLHDYGVIDSYIFLDTKADGKCLTSCAALVSSRNSIQDATAACQNLNWNGGCVFGLSSVEPFGIGPLFNSVAGKLVCTAPVPAVTQQKCPPTWFCNGCSPVVAGGVTNDGKCRKEACNSDVIVPFPPNGTPIGTWGFFKDGGFWAWGSTANGGAPTTTTISPAIPGSGVWANCP